MSMKCESDSEKILSSLSAIQRGEIEKALSGKLRILKYPWCELEEEEFSGGNLDLLGYGSLLNPESARRTIPSTPVNGHPPAVGFGLRRVFNYRMPDSVVECYGIGIGSKERAALNCEVSGSNDSIFNARVLTVPFSDLEALRVRERGYDLVRVPMLSWPLRGAGQVSYGFALCAPCPLEGEASEFVDDSLLPHQQYSKLCYEGSTIVGESFGELFLQSCYLSDRETTLRELWQKKGLL